MGHARAILGLPSNQQAQAAREIVAKALSVREAEKLIKSLQNGAGGKSGSASSKKVDPNIRALEQDLSDKLAASVNLQHGNNGKGKLVISYNSLEELDGILSHIK
jgi:ParB family chromosome partitioning protein